MSPFSTLLPKWPNMQSRLPSHGFMLAGMAVVMMGWGCSSGDTYEPRPWSLGERPSSSTSPGRSGSSSGTTAGSGSSGGGATGTGTSGSTGTSSGGTTGTGTTGGPDASGGLTVDATGTRDVGGSSGTGGTGTTGGSDVGGSSGSTGGTGTTGGSDVGPDARADTSPVRDVSPTDDTSFPPDVNDSACPRTRDTIRIGESVSGQIPGGRGDNDRTSCDDQVAGEEGEYTLVLSRRRVVEMSLDAPNAFGPALTLLDGCRGNRELACINFDTPSGLGQSDVIRRELGPGRYRIRIDTRDFDSVSYTLRVEAETLASNATCQSPRPISANQPAPQISNANGAGGINVPCFGNLDNVRFYSISVPANSTLDVSAQYASTVLLPTYVGTSCAGTCQSSEAPNASEPVSVVNTSQTTRSYVVAIENRRRQSYTIQTEINPLASNATCSSAERFSEQSPVQPDWARAQPDGALCPTVGGNTLFYQIDVPARQRLFLDVSEPNSDVVTRKTRVRSSCSSSSSVCIDDPYDNETGQTQTFIVEAISDGTGQGRLEAELVELESNRQCQSPQQLDIGSTLRDEDVRGGTPAIFTPCSTGAGNGTYTLFYRLDIPQSVGRVRVQATPSDPQNTSLSLQATPVSNTPCGSIVGLRCLAEDVGANRSSPQASITIDPDSLSGRDPAPVLIGATIDPDAGPGATDIDISATDVR